ncbi:MAG: SDR family oxidoreductase [Burkholderiaceae bacterium]|nr:SDR family oxidoreductase [Burkholderiaceae bacterium]
MRVHLTNAGAITLCEPTVFNSLDVLVDPQSPERLEQAIARIGSRDGADHVRLSPSVLRFLSSHAGSAEWETKFDAMIGYAASKGWLDEQGRVRAHLTFGESREAVSASDVKSTMISSEHTLSSATFDNNALQGKVAVVTGASGGLGLAICQRLQSMGAQVVQVDISYPAHPSETAGMLALHCDIADPASITAMADLARSRFGRCDVLVNNAAISSSPVGLEDFPIELWDRIFHVNLHGALLCAQALAPMMFGQQAGSIINVASIAAQVATRVGAYGPTKAALRALTHQMAVEWGPHGIRANSVSPGMIRTPLSEVHYRDEAKLQSRTAKIPARRIGRPEDIGDAVAFLASDASTYINGQDIVVDGGFLKASLANLY